MNELPVWRIVPDPAEDNVSLSPREEVSALHPSGKQSGHMQDFRNISCAMWTTEYN